MGNINFDTCLTGNATKALSLLKCVSYKILTPPYILRNQLVNIGYSQCENANGLLCLLRYGFSYL